MNMRGWRSQCAARHDARPMRTTASLVLRMALAMAAAAMLWGHRLPPAPAAVL